MYSPAGACLLPSCIWHSYGALQALVQQQEPLQRKPDPDNSSGHSTEDHGANWWNCRDFGVCKSSVICLVLSTMCFLTGSVVRRQLRAVLAIERKKYMPCSSRARQAASMAANINRPPTPEAEHRELSMEDHVQLKVLSLPSSTSPLVRQWQQWPQY